MSNIESLIKCLEPLKLRQNEPMSTHTTLGVGGKADLFYTTENSGDLVKAVRLARSFEVPVTVIGEGSGVVVSDLGISGLVVRNNSERIQVKPLRNLIDILRKRQVKKALVVIDSGVDIDVAVDKLLSLGLVGLEKLSTYHGSIGAKVKNNESKEFLKKISILDEHGGVKSVGIDKEWGGGVVTDVTYLLSYGEAIMVKEKIDVARKKREEIFIRSAGKVFEDILEEDQQTLGYPSCDTGYIIGEILNMKGLKIGKMAISPDNQNIIVNLGGGKAKDFIALVEEIKRRARESIGLELVEKVVRLGEF